MASGSSRWRRSPPRDGGGHHRQRPRHSRIRHRARWKRRCAPICDRDACSWCSTTSSTSSTASPLVADLLSHCPDIQVLVTSRAPLHISGEHELLCHPWSSSVAGPLRLTCAGLGGGPPLRRSRPRGAEPLRADRRERGNDRRHLSSPGRPPARHRAGGVARATPSAEGDPGASRQPAYAPHRGWPGPPRATADAAGGDRLEPRPPQPSAADPLPTLAVFAGGWTLDAAEAVTGCDPPLPVFDGLDALHDTSLIRLQESVESRWGGRPPLRHAPDHP